MRRGFIFSISIMLAALGGCAVSPNPLTEAEVSHLASDHLQRVVADQEPISGAIDVYEAMARALKYNLDHRVEDMVAAVRIRELDLAHYNMLPNAVAGSGYAARDNDNASNSVNVLTGVESLATSTSQDRRIRTSDLAFSWNVLDFGLSYVRARQAADKVLVAEEMRRKVVSRIIEDVRTAYWRAVSADNLIQRLSQLEGRIRRAQANARASSDERQTSPITAATYERELVEIKRAIQELQRELSVSRTQLSALMNLKPGTKYHLAGGTLSRGPGFAMPVSEMISTAVNNRAELKEVWYQRRINEHEIHAAMLELLPGLTPYAGTNYDSNDFLFNSNWLSWGAKASWNLMRIVQYPARREVINAQGDQLDARALAVTMAVITQVHVSRIRYLQYSKELATASEFLDVQRRLVGLMRAEASADRISEQTLIREEMNTLVAEAKRDIAHAGLQNAFASVYASMGLDPYVGAYDPSINVKSLAARLRGTWVERGLTKGGRST
ncbi:MAG: TolC family protein [Hyphomicrobiaceae bacterium]|nr:TolC family protein [Hyphomicrobiaceae bacterium]